MHFPVVLALAAMSASFLGSAKKIQSHISSLQYVINF